MSDNAFIFDEINGMAVAGAGSAECAELGRGSVASSFCSMVTLRCS
ncbi:MAG: hypothetical protein GPOALKHO_000228 [Sodalis sp.]|nr:MAG: hypothetical protein GPOALKHO_000228 [Sodalis sp.]